MNRVLIGNFEKKSQSRDRLVFRFRYYSRFSKQESLRTAIISEIIRRGFNFFALLFRT
jgi:hypothetical protein